MIKQDFDEYLMQENMCTLTDLLSDGQGQSMHQKDDQFGLGKRGGKD